ncbi:MULTISPECIES: hypothetical protein [Aphanothece]|uniref:hypothetical protein n=1 Tax=Aphanothece TaxID=1121 RepID=UPI0039856A4B
MKLFIPSNSNNLSIIASTLSIAPCGVYKTQIFGYRRSSMTRLSPLENVLIALSEHAPPSFHRHPFDNDDEGGYPMYIEIDSSLLPQFVPADEQNNVFYTHQTVYLLDGFRLHFRNITEQTESQAKLLKTIEAKYYTLVKERSVFGDIGLSDSPLINQSFELNHSSSVHDAFVLDKAFGASLCGALAILLSNELDISIPMQKIINMIPLVLDRSSDGTRSAATEALEELDHAIKLYEKDHSPNQEISKRYGIDLRCLQTNPKNCEAIDLGAMLLPYCLKEGTDQPFLFRLYRLRELLVNHSSGNQTKTDSKDLKSLGARLFASYDDDRLAKLSSAKLEKNHILFYDCSKQKLVYKLHRNRMSPTDKSMLDVICHYLIFKSSTPFRNPDAFWPTRSSVLESIVNELKESSLVSDHQTSLGFLRSIYLGLDDPLFSLGGLPTPGIVMVSLAVLVLYGRNISSFITSCKEFCDGDILPGLILWGSTYGATSFPKTVAAPLCENPSSLNTLIKSYKEAYAHHLRGRSDNDLQLDLIDT